jgi:sugar phosphate isomerase/epimerase
MIHTYTFKRNYLHNPDFDVFAFIDLASAAGFSGLELSAYAPAWLEFSGGSREQLTRLRDRFEAERFDICLDNAGTDVDLLEGMIELAGTLGASSVRTFTRPYGATVREQMDKAVRDLRRIAPVAERAGIRVLLENHEDLTGEELAEVLRAVDSSWVQAIYDYGTSMVLLEDPVTALEPLLPWIRSSHLKDHVMLPAGANGMAVPSSIGVAIGSGNIPIMDITRRLIGAGLDSICFQSVWGYHPPVRDTRGGATLGEGAFAFGDAPYEMPRYCLDTEALARTRPRDVWGQEIEAFLEGLAWVKAAFTGDGLELPRQLDVDAARSVATTILKN